MKKANLACTSLSLACISGKFDGINLMRLQAKFDKNLKFTCKFCGANDSFKFDLKLNQKSLKFDEAPGKFNQNINPQPIKSSKMRVGKFYAVFSAEPSNFKLRNQKERTYK